MAQAKAKPKTKSKPAPKAKLKREYHHRGSGEVTEALLTKDLNDELLDAWQRLRESALELGPQRIYASHKSIMFARKTCYAFVRPKKSYLELVFFLRRVQEAPEIRQQKRPSRTKHAHSYKLVHADQVGSPLTDWLAEAYAQSLP